MKKILLPLLFVLFLLPLAVMGQCGSGLSVIDADGNSYATVKVGSYCWMQSNLKTRVPGSSIYWADMYPDTTANLEIYGRLYNWYAAMNVQPGETPVVSEHGFVQGVCPSGWHLPTADEISQLATYSVPGLHDTHYWMVPGTNTTAYTMRPGGYYNANRNRGEDLCGNSYMWTAQSLNPLSPSIVWSDCYCDHFVVDESAAGNGLSVRCVLGVFQAQVQTYAATNVKSNSADLNGEVFSAGLDENYTRGFVYGTDSEHLTVDTAQTGQSGEGTYSFTINDLAENTTYYYRAYVVNAFGVEYGELKSFTTTYMEVETSDENVVTMYAAEVNGYVVNMGGYESLNAGFLYGTDRSALTETAQRETAISATGGYNCILNGLMPDTKYYYCAYLTNGRQTVYGDTLDFTTAYMKVETAPATDVAHNSATLNGVLTDFRNFNENICGVVFRYGQRKDMLNHYSGGSTMDGPGDINNSVSNLSPNSTYYFQALAIHGTDTVWAADTLSFTTPTIPCPGLARTNEHATQADSPYPYKSAAVLGKHAVDAGIDSVRDVEGNSYATVLIGNQCWMAQNLRTTKYADGTAIVKGSAMSRVMPYRYFPDDDTNNVNTYGHLYNWMAVMNGADSSSANPSGVQGICPEGWHVPSNAEWNTLTQYVYNSDDPDYKCSSCESSGWKEATECIAKALASTTGWAATHTNSCVVGNDLSDNNATGFSAVPAGGIHASAGSAFFGQATFFWSATYEATPNKVHARNLYYNNGNVSSSGAYDSLGLSVRCLRDPLTVTTDSANTVTNNGATLYGNVKSLGKYATVKAGFRYGTSASTMTTKVDKTVNTYGSYNININNLSPNTTYYFQAYAYNETDTVYGKVMDFTTTTVYCPGAKRANEHATELGIDSVLDVDGNSYTTVLIGNQCWMAQNLRTTKYADGTAIERGTVTSTETPYRYFPGMGSGDSANVSIYGHLYNWPAVMGNVVSNEANHGEMQPVFSEVRSVLNEGLLGKLRKQVMVQGICPDGWHVPSDAEFDTLTKYVFSIEDYRCGNDCGDWEAQSSVNCIANALSAVTGWYSTENCCAGHNSATLNKTGFSAVPAGGYFGGNSEFNYIANFWSATLSGTKAYYRSLYSNWPDVSWYDGDQYYGFSVRCLRDPLTVTTDSVKEVTHNSATLYGNVKSLGKYATVKAGFRYGISADALTNRTADTAMTVNGIYSVTMNSLAPNSTYYFQAYAYSGTDTVYGKVMDFTTTTVYCPGVKRANEHATELGIDSVSDVDGNSYTTVLIGNQCWMAQNLRTTKYADGTAIEHGTETSSVKAYRYFPSDDTNNVNTYGHLYNWMAVMNGAGSSSANPSGVQGICPEGWHVPSDAEWTALTNYVKSKTEYRCGGYSMIGKALASTTGWNSSTSDACHAGYKDDKSNLTGFSAVPAGSYNRGYGAFGNDAYIYSATQTVTTDSAYYFNLYKGYGAVTFSKKPKTYGLSVRCLRDPLTVTTDSANTVTNNSATLYGNVKSLGEYNEVKAGLRYGISAEALTNRTADTAMTVNGIYSAALTNLAPNSTYYFQAYAYSGTDTVYGKVMDFTTTTVYCPGAKRANEHATELGIDSVSDVDGNSYATVLIGNQCWMAQNLKTITNPKGTGTIFTPNKPGYDTTIYGRLYDWAAVMQGSASSVATPSGVQGICPEGWHVPSDAEWTALTNYVASQSQYVCGTNTTNIAKALASTTGWNTHETSCAIGNDLSANNATGFSAVPAGYGDKPYFVGTRAYIWSATQNNTQFSFRILKNADAVVGANKTSMGELLSVRCLRDPLTVTTDSVREVTNNGAIFYGNVKSLGEYDTVNAGFRYGTSADAMNNYIADTVMIANGILSVAMTGLAENAPYYFQIYAAYGTDTVYGKVIDFQTALDKHCPSIYTVTDYDGNMYNTVQIGNQCWMAQNLRTTKYADGTAIEHGTDTSSVKAYRYFPGNGTGDTANVSIYGHLYNLPAVMNGAVSSEANPSGVRGICPEGWHVPSYAEWTQLKNYVNSVEDYRCGGIDNNIANALSSATGWSGSGECNPGYASPTLNATGFSAVPAGYFYRTNNTQFQFYANFWSATEYDSEKMRTFLLINDKNVYFDYGYKDFGCSVRCLLDPLTVVTKDSVSAITDSSATCGGNVKADGGAEVTARGVCWSMSQNPTIADSHTTDGTGKGSFTSTMKGLKPNNTYYVRAYAINSTDTVYGSQLSFFTKAGPCPNTPTVTDIDGNVYNTVQIGEQCWMAQNLRTITNPKNIGKIFTPSNAGYDTTIYGRLYNWQAVMQGSAKSDAIPSGVQGICPEGWHVPGYREFEKLFNYVLNNQNFKCGSGRWPIAKALASTTGWQADTINDCNVGFNPEINNTTGFNAVPAGQYYNSQLHSFGSFATFWSAYSSSDGSISSYEVELYNNSNLVTIQINTSSIGRSVRCLRDPLTATTDSVSSVTTSAAIFYGKVKSLGEYNKVKAGFKYGTSADAMNNHTAETEMTANGIYSAALTNLDPTSTYYFQAYACSGTDTVYGKVIDFYTASDKHCPGIYTVADHEGNIYNTVQIGSQCWMAQNMRCTTSPNGLLQKGETGSSDGPRYYDYPDATLSLRERGLLYNWYGAMDTTADFSYTYRRGICPEGWYVPSHEEWTQLTTYVMSHPEYVCEPCSLFDNTSQTSCIAKALASTTGWTTYTGYSKDCVVGYDTSANNVTGFSAVPAGLYSDGTPSKFGTDAYFCSATQSGTDYTWGRSLSYNSNAVGKFADKKSKAYSVRCLLDQLTVTTGPADAVTNNSATLYGNVKSLGKYDEVNAGFRYGTSANAMNIHTDDTTMTANGIYSVAMNSLAPNSTYYFQAYAYNSTDTVWAADTLSFTTPTVPCPGAKRANEHATELGIDSVFDVEGNSYTTVQIGNQCWMAQNLRTTKYADGTYIRKGTGTSTTTPYRYFPGSGSAGDTANVSIYGHLYNWPAVMNGASSSSANPSGVQGICPDGWHVPSAAEFNQLTTYVNSQDDYKCSRQNSAIAKALASTTGWNTSTNNCAVGNDLSANNATGFSAVPAGLYIDNQLKNFGNNACFWLTTYYDENNNAYGQYLLYSGNSVNPSYYNYHYGFSVRCLRDPLTVVTDATVSAITDSSAKCGGSVTAVEGVEVTAKGVCWSTSQNPTTADSHTTDGTGTGSFTGEMKGLTQSTTYYVRAYATSNVGTIYGNQVSFFTKGGPCPNTPTVTDIDGNVYNTVQIGSQCWMKENLRTITNPKDTGTIYTPNEAGYDTTIYGRLYDWAAVMQGAPSSSAKPSGVQGICPDGWHVPSNDEWMQMINYVRDQSEFQCNNSRSYIAKALASTTGWKSSESTCSIGKDTSANNATGFSVVPASNYASKLGDLGNNAYFWTATQSSDNMSYYIYLYYSGSNLNTGYIISKSIGTSVRCLRDPLTATTDSVKEVTHNSATLYGKVKSLGEYATVKAGFKYGTSANAMNNHAAETEMTANGIYSVAVNSLAPNNAYYFQAYAYNGTDTVYGSQLSFLTKAGPCPNAPTVTDVDGNVYNTVQIGNQCWMKENLKTTHYADGTSIESSAIVNPGNNASNVSTYGYLYKWQAVMNGAESSSANPSGVKGICPEGWHVPSEAEWHTLTNYVNSVTGYRCGETDNVIAKALASDMGWRADTTNDCHVGFNPEINNATGFSAVPAGYGGAYFEKYASIWSATSSSSTTAMISQLRYDVDQVSINGCGTGSGCSVRCLRDPLTATTDSVKEVTHNSATLYGKVKSLGEYATVKAGFKYGTSANAMNNHATETEMTANGIYSVAENSLAPNNAYYFQAYAYNGTDTVYGSQLSFLTKAGPCPNAPTVTDVDGNVYNTVQIGNQCWMKENLKTTHYADGASISNGGTNTSTSNAYRYFPGNDTNNVATYGHLYNWKAVMGSSTSSNNIPSGVQGICPTGWHVPSDAEWDMLTTYVNGVADYRCGETNNAIANALSAVTGWQSPSECGAGHSSTTLNKTGFSAVPAGIYLYGSFYLNFNSLVHFWSATQSSKNAYFYELTNNATNVNRYNNDDNRYGLSVRCLRD